MLILLCMNSNRDKFVEHILCPVADLILMVLILSWQTISSEELQEFQDTTRTRGFNMVAFCTRVC